MPREHNDHLVFDLNPQKNTRTIFFFFFFLKHKSFCVFLQYLVQKLSIYVVISWICGYGASCVFLGVVCFRRYFNKFTGLD